MLITSNIILLQSLLRFSFASKFNEIQGSDVPNYASGKELFSSLSASLFIKKKCIPCILETCFPFLCVLRIKVNLSYYISPVRGRNIHLIAMQITSCLLAILKYIKKIILILFLTKTIFCGVICNFIVI